MNAPIWILKSTRGGVRDERLPSAFHRESRQVPGVKFDVIYSQLYNDSYYNSNARLRGKSGELVAP